MGDTDGRASILVEAIESAWRDIQDRHRTVPDVFVTLAGAPKKYGHFAVARWANRSDLPELPEKGEVAVEVPMKSELFVGGEGLQRGAREVFATLLHEAVHGACHEEGIQDTSRQGRYHNLRFKRKAEDFGLWIDEAPGIGWSLTRIPEETAEEWATTIQKLDDALTMVRLDEVKDETKPDPQPALECECPRKIRASKKVRQMGSIMCSVCDNEFIEGGY